VRETALLTGPSHALVAVLSHPQAAASGRPPPAALFLNAGFQHHVGPHDIYVRLARELADLGFLAVRLDCSGLGDSPARTDNAPPEQSHLSEARAVMDDLAARFGCRSFVSLGVCSGARDSLRLAFLDERVRGALLINPTEHLHDDTALQLTSSLRARTLRRHYLRLLLRSSFRAQVLRQVLRGDFDTALLGQALRGLSQARPSTATSEGLFPSTTAILGQLRSLLKGGVNVQHVYSEGDQAIDYFYLLLGPHAREVPHIVVRGVNHTFTPLWCRDRLSSIVSHWAQETLAVLQSGEEGAAQ